MLFRIVCYGIFISVLTAAAQQKQPVSAPAPSGDFQISGTLVDSVTGQALKHARVAVAPVTRRDNLITVVTGEDGRFAFLKLAPGKYALTAQARGYLLQSFNQHERFSTAIAVGPGFESSGLLFRLPPESSISGTITDEAGEPVHRAEVLLFQSGVSFGREHVRLRAGVMSDDEGAFRFGHLPPGRYLIAVSATPWYAQRPQAGVGGQSSSQEKAASVPLDVAYPITFYPGVTEPGSASSIALGRGENALANLSLQPVPALRMIVKSGDWNPGEMGQMMLQRRVFDGVRVTVPTQSRYISRDTVELVGIPAGRYTLRNFSPGTSEGGDAEADREIEVPGITGADANDGHRFAPLTVFAHLDSGQLPAQAMLRLEGKRSSDIFDQRLAAGQADFKHGVPPGEYEISLLGAPGLYIKTIVAPGAAVNGRTLEVHGRVPLRIKIALANGQAVVNGTALRDGQPLGGAMIVLVPADPAHNQVLFRRDQSDSDGGFTLANVVPGKYTLLALEHGWELEWMKPEALEPYMMGGVQVEAQQHGRHQVTVDVQ